MTSQPAGRRRKLPAHYAGIVMPFILSLFMTLIVSAIATLRSVGPQPDFVWLWMSAWGLSWLVAFPVLLFALPVARRLVGFMVETPPSR